MKIEIGKLTWQDLHGKFSPEVVEAPNTYGDTLVKNKRRQGEDRTLHYLISVVAGSPWADHLVLVAAINLVRNVDVQTVYFAIARLHPRLIAIFADLRLQSMDDWEPQKYLPAYMRGEIVASDSRHIRSTFWRTYSVVSKSIEEWFVGLSDPQKKTYQRFLLPRIDQWHVEGYIQQKEADEQAQEKRKVETDAVVPYFAEIRKESHLRRNRLFRLLQAYEDAVTEVKQNGLPLPYSFSYVDGGERLHFQLWDRLSFVLHHPSRGNNTSSRKLIARTRRGASSDEYGAPMLMFIKAEALENNDASEGFWFLDIFRLGLIGHQPLDRSEADAAPGQEWLRRWGYGSDSKGGRIVAFHTNTPGLLSWPHRGGIANFIKVAQQKTEGVFLPVESIYAAATFGLLAVDLITTTGMRANELQQMRLSDDCLFRTSKKALPDAAEQSERVRYGFRLIPKGERQDKPANYFVGNETLPIVEKVVHMLHKHYGVGDESQLPIVRFQGPRAHRFGDASYLLQYNHHALNGEDIAACLRFLLHGMVFQTANGKNIILKLHLLRHVFATYAVQVEQLPIDIVGIMLNHKNLATTQYYSARGPNLARDHIEAFLDHLAAHVDLDEAMLRTPDELRLQMTAAVEKVGTLHEVLGGSCTYHAICPIQFACVGCAANVPDPAKRYQVEREKKRAEHMADLARKEGRYPDAQRWKQQTQKCVVLLKEMDEIEAYRKDETRHAIIRPEEIA